MPSQWALQEAAKAWCSNQTSHLVMDAPLATIFAEILDRRVRSPLTPMIIAFQEDSDYAHAWYANLVMAFKDAGCEDTVARAGAKTFMTRAFDFDASNFE